MSQLAQVYTFMNSRESNQNVVFCFRFYTYCDIIFHYGFARLDLRPNVPHVVLHGNTTCRLTLHILQKRIITFCATKLIGLEDPQLVLFGHQLFYSIQKHHVTITSTWVTINKYTQVIGAAIWSPAAIWQSNPAFSQVKKV